MLKRPSAGSRSVQAVARAFELLEALGRREESRLSELARDASLHPSTAHRLLVSLIECGYAVQSPTTGRYRLARKVQALASSSKAHDVQLRIVARPHLEAIRAAIDETTNLVALDGLSVVYLDQVESRHAVRLFAEPGRRVSVHTSGAGKAMLAFQQDSLLERLLRGEPFERLTAHTITAGVDLRNELARVRERGYALDNEEYEEGVSCVGAPIIDGLGSASAAISVSAPSVRLHRCGLDRVGALLSRHAREISLLLADGALGHG